MARPLDEYRRKRDFARTPEPSGDGSDAADVRAFVVHRHEARRLHYDLRLQVGGVLESFAVPKGFSYDPADKHLAVRTEPHPMQYLDFEGMIPPGEYGAGAMTVWDRGEYDFVVGHAAGEAALDEGELKLVLRGGRLRGEWHLVRTNQKGDDGKPLPKQNWLLFKSKDRYAGGARDTAFGIDLSGLEPSPMPKRVTPMRPADEVAPFADRGWIFEMAFAGERLLAEVDGERLRLRGLKRAPGEVLDDLAELRCERGLLDGVLVALDDQQRPDPERLAARLAGDEDIDVVYYAFDLLHVDGFDLRGLPLLERKTALRAALRDCHGHVQFVDHVAAEGDRLAAVVRAAGLPALIAKRAESPYAAGASDDWRRVPVEADGSAASDSVSDALAALPARDAPRSRVKFSNLDKVFWPAEGYTKGDLVAWYEHCADLLVPHLADRPIHMQRFPDGIEGKSFYQREANETVPQWLSVVEIPSGSRDMVHRHAYIEDRDGLLALANLGSIDLHPWLSRRQFLDTPDFAVLDLDPKSAPFGHVVRIARELGKLLRGIGLRPLLKTSGKTGLHIYVPLLEGAYSYDQARMFCEGVARCVVRDLPDIATVERSVGSRGGKVYVDFGQNRAGQTVVPPYSVRPVPGAQVSAPLHWDELDGDLSLAQYTIMTMPERLERMGDLFRPALTDRQDLLPAIERLQAFLQR